MEKLKAMMSPKTNESNKKLQEDDMSSTKTSLNDVQAGNILNNTSSVIQNTFQYIYEFEKKKMEKVV